MQKYLSKRLIKMILKTFVEWTNILALLLVDSGNFCRIILQTQCFPAADICSASCPSSIQPAMTWRAGGERCRGGEPEYFHIKCCNLKIIKLSQAS